MSLQMPVQVSSAQQQETGLPEGLLERLDGFAADSDVQNLRDQLEEALDQLKEISAQLAAMQSAQALPASPVEVSSMQADGNTAGARPGSLLVPATASADSPIFSPILNEQASYTSAPKEQQVQNWQQQQQQQVASPRARKVRQITNTPVNADSSGNVTSYQTASAQTKAETIDRASSAASGWEMYSDSQDPSQALAGGQQEETSLNQASNKDSPRTLQQQAPDNLQQKTVRGQASASTRGRAGSIQKQGAIHQQQQLAQPQASIASGDVLQPVVLGTQALVMGSTDTPLEAGKQVPATVQLVPQEVGMRRDTDSIAGATNLGASTGLVEQFSVGLVPGNLARIPEASISFTQQQADAADGNQQRNVGQTLIMAQRPEVIQAAWIPRPKTATSGGSAGEAQESLTVDQLAASLQTVAGVVHAMALGPPSQATSANSLVQSDLLPWQMCASSLAACWSK